MTDNLPDIYFFNPTCEYAVANGSATWQPNLLLQKMEKDLCTLPLFLTRKDDVVLVREMPSPEFINSLKKVFIQVPEFYCLEQINNLKSLPKNRLLPWGWSPAAHRLLDPLIPTCSDRFKSSPVATWKKEFRDIYSRKFAIEILKQLLPLLPAKHVMQEQYIPQICTTRHEIEALLARWGRLMVKAPWSSSGRGLQRITKTPVAVKVWEKLLGIVREQGYAIVEPYLEKVMDMSLQFYIQDRSVHFTGISRFITDAKGQYQGNYLNGWPGSMTQKEILFAEEMADILAPQLVRVLEGSLLSEYYEGNFGVDTLIFRDDQQRLRINPCLEINVRQSMGLLSLQLEKLLMPGTKGIFRLFYQKGMSFSGFVQEMTEKEPLLFTGNRIKSGFLPLTPAEKDPLFGAWLFCGNNY